MNELKKALSGEFLSQSDAHALVIRIMNGELSPIQTAGVLMALRTRGESTEEIAGFAKGMREAAVRVWSQRQPLMDIVGTGGVAPDAFNISTTTCFVAAAAGVAVAKHGNRAASSKSGSFDLIEALGIRIDLPAAKIGDSIDRFGLGFLFARNHHPAMRYVAPVRAELGVRTVFNLLGPLTNPAFARLNLVGVSHPSLLEPFAQVLHQLGSQRALVVHGQLRKEAGFEPVDELVLGHNQVAELNQGQIKTYTLLPEDLGLASVDYAALEGGTAQQNAEIAKAILAGQHHGPKRDAVLLNAGAAFYLAGQVTTVAEGVDRARQVLQSGEAMGLLERVKAFSQA